MAACRIKSLPIASAPGSGGSTPALCLQLRAHAYRDKRLIRNHVIPFVHVPGHDLGLFETFAKIGQHELPHGMCSAGLN